jgi:hypothetical protein
MRKPFCLLRTRAAFAAVTFAVAFPCARPAAAAPVLPDFSPDDFAPGAEIDNRYFPLVPGTRYRYSGTVTDPESGETAFEEAEDSVTFGTELVAGVTARVVHARSWEDGVLAEDTSDWYAQDRDGNVWYLGEDTTAFEYDDDGNLVGTSNAGSWRAGVNGARPGYIMPANPVVGFTHYQEFAPADEALDQAEVLSLDESVSVPAGSFDSVLKTAETSEVEPDVLEHKYWAPGVGLVKVEEDIDAAGVPLNTIVLQSVSVAAIPLPPAAWAALLAAGVLNAPRAMRAVAQRGGV